VQYARAVSAAATLTVRADVVRYGEYQYDDANTAAQSAYSLTNLRAGIRGKRLFGEAWMRNAFDTRYVPIAFAYPGLGAVRVHRRERRAAHVRRARRGDILKV